MNLPPTSLRISVDISKSPSMSVHPLILFSCFTGGWRSYQLWGWTLYLGSQPHAVPLPPNFAPSINSYLVSSGISILSVSSCVQVSCILNKMYPLSKLPHNVKLIFPSFSLPHAFLKAQPKFSTSTLTWSGKNGNMYFLVTMKQPVTSSWTRGMSASKEWEVVLQSFLPSGYTV